MNATRDGENESSDGDRRGPKTFSITICPLQYHYLMCIEIDVFILEIGPNSNKEL